MFPVELSLKWIIAVFIIAINILGFILAGIDKYKAKRKLWRIPEKTLFLTAVLGATLGLYFGFIIFRHKTKRLKFMLGIPLIFIAQVIVLLLIIRA